MELDHLVFLLSDLEASLPYYEALLSLLGFEARRAHVFVNGAGLALEFKQAGRPEAGYDRYGVGLNHLGFAAPTRAAVEYVAAEMARRGFETPAIQELEGDYALFMKDRDGIRFEITCYGSGVDA